VRAISADPKFLMSDKPKLPPEDRELFRRSVGEVRRLRHDRSEIARRSHPPHPTQRERDEQRVLQESLSQEWDPAELETGEHVHYSRPGLQRSILRKLQRGQFRVEASLDLHGYNRHAARETLSRFLHASRSERRRCVRIVHGKGLRSTNHGPVLKPLIQHWLKRRDEVLAYCSARAVDGGSGALYVLIKSL
jgi:DNA-nicking Smr family endonuclease